MRLAHAIRFALLLVLAAPTASTASSPLPTLSGLVLNEFMAGPARDWDSSGTFSSRDDEWIELRNAGDLMIDLSAYFITDGDSIPRLGLSGSLAGGAYLVAFGGDAYAWERDHGFPAFGFSLGNSGDAVLLWCVTDGDTALVDAYAYRSHEAAADRSVGRLLDIEGWALFDSLNPYTGGTPPTGTGCAPSPGGLNACGATVVQRSTWGRLKTLYR